jgi:hypothetical protein
MSVLGRRLPTGERLELELVLGRHEMTATEVGATLRSCAVEGADVLDGFRGR